MLSTKQNQLHQKALAAAKRYQIAHADLLSTIMEVNAAKLYLDFKLASLYAYCLQELKLTEDVACSFISVARKAEEVPELKKAVDQGLPFTKAKIVARVITPKNQEELLETAKVSSCNKLEREVVKENPKAAVVEKVVPVAEDRYRLELGISEDLLEKLRRVQDLVCNKERRAASLEESLAAMAELYLEREDPQRKAERARETKKAPNLTADKIPAASYHAVQRRDKGRCQIPGCANTRWIDIHHVVLRSQGGTHEVSNLLTLCGFHHREHHRANSPPPALGKGFVFYPPQGG